MVLCEHMKGPRQTERMKAVGRGGANIRNVWTIPTQGFSESHYATFPPKLVETCIKAGTSERGCCGACGAPWESELLRSPVEGTGEKYGTITSDDTWPGEPSQTSE